jgi:sulfide:quinone oxidoreductase
VARIVILGAGFGGLEAAIQLRKNLGPEHAITLIDKEERFHLGPTKLWVAVGERTEAGCYTDRGAIRKKGVDFVKDAVTQIEPKSQTVVTAGHRFRYDFLIVALGADPAPELVKGFENAFNLYEIAQGEKIHRELQKIEKGTISIVITRPPFKAGGAPYEAAFIIDDFLRKQKKREQLSLRLFTPEPRPLSLLGKPAGDRMESMLKERNIEYHPNSKLIAIKAKSVLFDTGELQSDLTLMVPPHVVPSVAKMSGLADHGGWIDVDRRYLSTKFEGIYAIGDCTGIRLANGHFLVKAGVIAEAEARVVANNIVSELKGLPKDEFDGKAQLISEVGLDRATMVEVDFFAEPNPVLISMAGPSEEYKRRKIEFEKERITRWFDSREKN